MRVRLAATIALTIPGAAGAAPLHGAALSSLASFDLADLGGPRSLVAQAQRDENARYLAPDIDAPPGLKRKPAKVRIRGRHIKLRIPLG